MKLLSKPSNLDYSKEKKYEEFKFFRLALTERNWVGTSYIPKESCSWFIKELKELDEKFYALFGNILEKTRFDFIIDTSVFSSKLPQNDKLLEFLEELDDFYVVDSSNPEKVKTAKKYQSKLHGYANQIENLTYLYRWVMLNPDHSFSSDLMNLLNATVNEHGKRAKNVFLKNAKKTHEALMKKLNKGEITAKEKEVLEEKQMLDVVKLCENGDRDFMNKVLKYTFDEPSLFFYGIYILINYYKETETLYATVLGYEFISIQRKGKGIELYLRDSTEIIADMFLYHETFIDTLPKLPRNINGTLQYYHSLYHLTQDEPLLEEEKIEVLKTIVKWVASRIPYDKKNSLPNKKWFHQIKNQLLLDAGVRALHFESNEVIGGPEGEELLVKAMAHMNDKSIILYPIFDTSSWDNLNSKQCALLAYSICLYHDICIENNYELISYNESPLYDYELITKDSGIFSPLQTISENSNKSTKEKEKKQEKERRGEHWVSFHFRRLRPNQSSSAEAKQKAAHYGIKELPRGFTFVDSFVRGERTVDVTQMKISALDVLNRTLNKLNTYDGDKNSQEDVQTDITEHNQSEIVQ